MVTQIVDYESAIEAVSDVIKKAQNEVLISTGSLDSKCYESDKLMNHISEAMERGVKFFVLTGPEIDDDSEKAKELLREDIYVLNKSPNVHFTLADGKHIRLESLEPKIHGTYKNITRFNDQLNGNYLRHKFFDALSRAQRYVGLDNRVRR